MSKETNIFELYEQLNKAGQRGNAQKYIAELCGVKVGTVKMNWILNKEIPNHIEEETQDKIIFYLQKQIAINNQ